MVVSENLLCFGVVVGESGRARGKLDEGGEEEGSGKGEEGVHNREV